MLEHGDYYLVVDDVLRIAHERAVTEEGVVIADIYRNPDDYREGRVMRAAFSFMPSCPRFVMLPSA